MKKFLKLFNKIGGINVIKQYLYAHVFVFAVAETLLLGFARKSLEIVRLAVNNRIYRKLRKKYSKFIKEYMKTKAPEVAKLERKRSDKVWVMWLQGIDNAPQVVQKCVKSLQDNLSGREFIFLTEDNYRDYVTFPDYVQKKIDEGIITRTHMSDLLRVEVLNKFGGTWIDATVFCSGSNYPSYMFDSDFFVFQNLKPGLDGDCVRISSWFMTSCTNNPILLLTRELLYDYWKKHNRMVDYFLIHDFVEMSIEQYNDEWNKVVPFANSTPHILLLRLFEPYDEAMWEAIKSQTAIHKLTYKFDKNQTKLKDTYYSRILK